MKLYSVYILKCADLSYYVGVTNDVERRLAEHQAGEDPRSYTFRRRPVELMYNEEFQSIWDAIEWEKRLKGWSRAKKEALIKGDWGEIQRLARRRGRNHPSTGSG